MPKPPRLVGDLIVRKGDAAPAVAASARIPDKPAATVETRPVAGPAPVPHGLAGTIAVTVRLDPVRYERLKIYGVRQRRTNQELLVEAIDAFLEGRAGGMIS
jgi:hypothetical protein